VDLFLIVVSLILLMYFAYHLSLSLFIVCLEWNQDGSLRTGLVIGEKRGEKQSIHESKNIFR